jgi:hypothetical protein
MSSDVVLVPHEVVRVLLNGGNSGRFSIHYDPGEGVAMVNSVTDSAEHPYLDRLRDSYLESYDALAGVWNRVPADLHLEWWRSRNRGASVRDIKPVLLGKVIAPPPTGMLTLTVAADVPEEWRKVGVPEIAAWMVGAGYTATPLGIVLEGESDGVAQLEPGWPVSHLQTRSVAVVGTGSIGAAAAEALATYGLGKLVLIDYDRLLWHNLIRHVGSRRHVGMHKVHALARELRDLRPDTVVETHLLDVVHNADVVRGLLPDVDLVLCAADGVAARRTVSHLARRAKKDAVLACVLGDGAWGEVIRLRPRANHGCLLCLREHQVLAGAIDPEPAIDGGYDTGSPHRPMTAVGGDLHLVGQLAAKIAVATLLERSGQADQILPGELAIAALRPEPGRPAPFNLTFAGETGWSPAWTPLPGCPSCEPV